MRLALALVLVALGGCVCESPECKWGLVESMRDCDGEWGGEATCLDAHKAPVTGCLMARQYDATTVYEFDCVATCMPSTGALP